MNFIVYILYSKKLPRTYVGYTHDLSQRLFYHNSGKVIATKYYKPWIIIYTEILANESEAKKRERYWKTGAGRRNIKKILNGSPPKFR